MSYTKVSNNDRRKTARRLRAAANCRNVQISPSALGRLIKAEDRSYRGILRTLADVHVVDIPDSEVEEMENPLEEIKDDAHWFIEQYEREAWCEEVTRLGRQM